MPSAFLERIRQRLGFGRIALTQDALPKSEPTEAELPKMRLVEGAASHFVDETTQLLRSRLNAVVWITTLVFGTPFVLAIISGHPGPLPSFRAINLLLCVILLIIFGRFRKIPGSVLRTFEFGIYIIVSLQLVLMLWAGIFREISLGNPFGAATHAHVLLAGWALLLQTFTVLLPNTWKRALSVMLPLSLLPYLATWWMVHHALPPDILTQHIHELGLCFEQGFQTLIPISLFSVVTGTISAHVLYSVRRQAFRNRQLGQYVLKEKLGSGGMGEVYRAEHQLLKRPCAVKLIHPEKAGSPITLLRFEREVQATAQLTHLNTVEIFDYGRSDDGTFYCVMELLPGMTLDELVKHFGVLPAGRVIWFLRQVCGALHEAHSKGLIHRDIKPANIFAAERGGVFDVAKLLDFGLVRKIQSRENIMGEKSDHGVSDHDGERPITDSETVSRPGRFCGTPFYMCPEQAKNYENLDARSDIYSLGAVAYYLLTGRPPFVGNSIRELVAQHLQSRVEPPKNRNNDVPEDLEAIVLRCLEKAPENRFQNVIELEHALAACHDVTHWNASLALEWWQRMREVERLRRLAPIDPDAPTIESANLPL